MMSGMTEVLGITEVKDFWNIKPPNGVRVSSPGIYSNEIESTLRNGIRSIDWNLIY